MNKSSSRRFPVTVTQLPVTRCQICHRTVAYRPGNLTEVLTEHYRRAHPEALELASRYPARYAIAGHSYLFLAVSRSGGAEAYNALSQDDDRGVRRC